MRFELPTHVIERKKDLKLGLEVMLFLLIVHESHGHPQEEINPLQSTEDEDSAHTVVGPVPICEGATFCEETPYYPTDIVSRAIKKNPRIVNNANVEMIDINSRGMEVPEEEPLCLSVERIIYPKSAETMNKEWLFVVNHPNFTQSVLIEVCVEEDSSCKVIDGFAEGYITACKQKFIYRQLSAIATDGSISYEFFRFPTSCCCHVEFTGLK